MPMMVAFYNLLLLSLLGHESQAFLAPGPTTSSIRQFTQQHKLNLQPQCLLQNKKAQIKNRAPSSTTTTTLYNGVIIDVPDNFFTFTFFSIGLFYSLGKAYNRYLLEEVAFEQRKLEARERRLEADPTLSELDLRREESGEWKSVYGRKFRGEGETLEGEADGSSRRGRRTAVLDRDEDDDMEDDFDGMSDEEIDEFESRYGVEYDPYYDEPYEESELPVGKYKEDKSYGDRRYDNGEVFYKDENSGLFYRQGSRPRQKKFWDLNSS
eukprot:CAMPEP_0183710152 /NCGR_PEP_ID=MMETSP0737-20130205/5975_1 /TAXON_ID=385413 /ORGANISM="Thalassiosira miniscula, Strain CCMP1093" /LENGTH=266 /DNA_ID=CAMNT_0025938375 /DNA_START=96 /DNA_END=896 /DNA_ORIENTATION=-